MLTYEMQLKYNLVKAHHCDSITELLILSVIDFYNVLW